MSGRTRSRLILEELESRTLLSASSLDTLVATPLTILNPASQGSVSVDPQKPGHGHGGGGGGGVTNPTPPPSAYTPSQIRTAYGFDNTGDGTDQTIAIVDAYNDPNISSDLKTFNTEFKLPQFTTKPNEPTFTVVNQTGGDKLPGRTNPGWAAETSLDVEWAHAMAPKANIVLVEANSSSLSNLMSAVHTAASYDGVSVVSMSWGTLEFARD